MEKNEKSQDSRENRQKYRKKFRQNGAQGEREGQNRQAALCFASFPARPHLCTGNGSLQAEWEEASRVSKQLYPLVANSG